MVTSTIIFPAAIDVNPPQSAEQTSEKPITEVYIDRDEKLFLVTDRNDSANILSIPEAGDDRIIKGGIKRHPGYRLDSGQWHYMRTRRWTTAKWCACLT